LLGSSHSKLNTSYTGGLRQPGSGMINPHPSSQTKLRFGVVAHMGGAYGNGIKKLGTPVNIEIAGNWMFIPADVIGFNTCPTSLRLPIYTSTGAVMTLFHAKFMQPE